MILIIILILCVICWIGSWGGLDETFLNPDTFLGGTFKGIKIKNWSIWDKLNPAKLFR